MEGNIVRFEIGGKDTSRAGEFYKAVFGWKVADGPLKSIEGAGLPGHLNALGHEPHSYVTFYVEVDQIESAVARVEAAGGKKIVGPVKLPTGRFAWIADLDGNIVGLWEETRPENSK